ncbi:acyltransferase [Burkholderia sp. BCCIQ04A]|uniref:Acyltransferase n=1 Tax=Burkholderia anthinoferrum TaxID=3090833 RepID=A0ABU5WTJ3_9BURK|nr:acyltransferase [Burkholderia anthinoferrum]MEB2535918.1 acyltransferase [Burkholderia anthinoferrum]MEB2562046.1 acyltransferase [Burkholderia anthinoferrum]MEB2582346.1 acyltransferase [Burkholderia anthinoferrum]MEB2632672.1 acyltransferase [Burkholderia anthinoferrum]
MLEKRESGRIRSLDGLRGIAAVSVGVFHGLLHYDTGAVQRVFEPSVFDVSSSRDVFLKMLLSVFNGHSAVIIFFVLSGFVLTESMKKMEDWGSVEVVSVFVVKRIFRIYPAVLGCMAFLFLCVIIFSRTGLLPFPDFSFFEVSKAALLVDTAIDGPLYTLQIELCAVPFLLLVHFLRKKIGVLADFIFVFYSLLALQVPLLVFGFSVFAANMLAFACGGMLASASVSTIFAEMGGRAWVFVLTVLIGITVFLSVQMYTVMLVRMFAAALLVGLIANQDNFLSDICCSKVAVFFGKISYSYYLYNVPSLYISYAVVNKFVPAPQSSPLVWGVVISIGSLVLATPLSVLSYRYIENPCARMASRLGKTRTESEPASRLANGL